jgi:hypothetical protein
VIEITEKKRRPDGQQRAADIAHDKNEEGEVKPGEAHLVHLYPRPNQQNGSADGADDVRKQRAEKKKARISGRRGVTSRAQMDSCGNNEERTDHSDEADILEAGV